MEKQNPAHESPVEHEQVMDSDLEKALVWAHENLKLLIGGIVAILLVVASFSGYDYWTKQEAAKQANELATIIHTKTDDAKLTALQAFIKKSDDSIKPAALLALASESLTQKDYKTAAAAFADLKGKVDKDFLVLARLGEAASLMDAGENAKAAGLLISLKQSAPETYKLPVTVQLALAAEAAGDMDTALAAYDELAGTDGQIQAFYAYKAGAIRTELAKAE